MNPEIDQTHVDGSDGTWQPVAYEPEAAPSWRPTRKWCALLITEVATLAGSWIVTGEFDDVERGLAAAALLTLATTYFTPNQPTPSGVPEK